MPTKKTTTSTVKKKKPKKKPTLTPKQQARKNGKSSTAPRPKPTRNAKGHFVKGNKESARNADLSDKIKCLEQYAAHLASGYSIDTFVPCDYRTVEKYLLLKDSELQPAIEEVKKAKREGLRFWEEIGILGTTGKMKGFNPLSWKFIVMNKLKWTARVDQTTNGEKVEAPKTTIINTSELTGKELDNALQDALSKGRGKK